MPQEMGKEDFSTNAAHIPKLAMNREHASCTFESGACFACAASSSRSTPFCTIWRRVLSVGRRDIHNASVTMRVHKLVACRQAGKQASKFVFTSVGCKVRQRADALFLHGC